MEQLCRAIGMPEEVTQILLTMEPRPLPTEPLLRRETWDQGLQELRRAIGDDPRGFRMLHTQLGCALAARQVYHRLGLSERIYIDTMAAFSRFVKEHLVSFGCYGFDRDFWTVRQIACVQFRIGELEYCLTREQGEKVVYLHIPSDADLSLPRLRASYLEARATLRRVFPDYADVPIISESWLFSPALAQFLPEDSRILDFQRSFTIRPCRDGREDVLLWVFKHPGMALEALPVDTRLQRALKPFLRSGGVFPVGQAVLKADPFL